MNFFINIDIANIIINDGNATPIVASIDPKIPPCDDPTNVAILIAIGPGVDSDIAIKFNNSSLFF